MTRILALALPLALGACTTIPGLSPHRMEIQQGNFITQEMVAQLKPGMTRDQVRFLLGTPLAPCCLSLGKEMRLCHQRCSG